MIVWSLNVNFVFYLYCQKDGKQGCDVPEDVVRGVLCYFVKSYCSIIPFRSLTNFLCQYSGIIINITKLMTICNISFLVRVETLGPAQTVMWAI